MSGENNEVTVNAVDENDNTVKVDIADDSVPAEELTFKNKLRQRGLFSHYFVACVFIFVFSLIVYVMARLSPAFAEFWSRYPAYWIKLVLSKITGIFSFSVAELLLISMPVLMIYYLVASLRASNNEKEPYIFYKWLLPLVCVVLIILSCFFSAFSPGYFRYGLDKNLSIIREEVSGRELFDTAVRISDEMEALIDDVNFGYGQSSVMPYDYNELSDKINAAFKKYAEKTDYIDSFASNPKPIALSELFTYTHISGVYTFMTSEANININYPDFIIPYTMAHEMAHQRGIAREDEANFVAFLVCMESDDAYIRYSGYTNMLDYLTDALYSADRELYSEFNSNHYPKEMRSEFSAYSAFFKKYSNSKASAVTKTVNDAFLKSQQQKAGTKSYGLVVDLTVAYYKNR